MNEQKNTVVDESVSSYVIEAWKCPKCGANNKFNPNICTSCNYSKIPPIQLLPPKSRKIWEQISRILICVMMGLQLFYAISQAIGFGLTFLFGIDGLFLDTALESPDMLLYCHFGAAGVSILLLALCAYKFIGCLKNKDLLEKGLRTACVCQLVALWSFPVLNIVVDMVVTSIRVNDKQLRPTGVFDLFDMGVSILVPIIITAVTFVIMFVNSRFGSSEEDPEEE